ncbi:MAG: hypothetical protein KG003_04445 [Bacteroidetes bacterium]|nr:hypothetical protein [Bacteroidota bacterium]
MAYFFSKYNNIIKVIDNTVTLVPMQDGHPEYQLYLEFLQTDTEVTHSELFAEEEIGNRLALHVAYPELANMPYKLLQLDNLEGIKRDSTLADKGLKGEKKYKKDGKLIWSSEKKYWFQPDGYPEGFRRIVKLYNMNGTVADSWEIFYELSDDDKEFFKKQQRELIFEYFKSQQPELFNLLYSFFKEEIDRYVMKDGHELAATLTDAALNHPYQNENGVYVVRETLSSEVPTQSGGTVTVLQGVLAELV